MDKNTLFFVLSSAHVFAVTTSCIPLLLSLTPSFLPYFLFLSLPLTVCGVFSLVSLTVVFGSFGGDCMVCHLTKTAIMSIMHDFHSDFSSKHTFSIIVKVVDPHKAETFIEHRYNNINLIYLRTEQRH